VSAEPRWISKRALLLLHEESLAEFGGARGLRDEGLLDSALARAPNKWAYGENSSTVAELAAAYAYALARGHAFVDGNKRAAFLAIGLFLALNGWRLTADKVEAVHAMVGVAAGALDEAGLASWIERRLEAL
jgi:death on curing protein